MKPKPRSPDNAELAYTRALARLVREIRRIVLASIDPAINRRLDAPGALGIDWPKLRVRLGQIIARQAGDLADTMLEQVSRFNKRDLERMLAIDINDEPAALRRALSRLRRENVALIKSIGAEMLTDVHRVVSRSVREGRRASELRELLVERFDVTESRADLIARDQTLKANSALTRVRHEQAGIDQYVWSTSKDERVRQSHQILEGRIFSWAEPPVTNPNGDRNNPGEDFQCRCVAIPVLG